MLLGGPDFWSNGIHLNAIEASPDPAEVSWRNINAIDDLIYEILNTLSHLVVAGLRGNAGAGGVMLALAADHVYAMSGVVLNPHYRSMGELYGSEYWTYTLPRRIGQTQALSSPGRRPISAQAARRSGLLDDAFGEDFKTFEGQLRQRATRLAQDPEFRAMLRKKHERRLDDEGVKPLASYRAEELARMRINFFGPDPAYHEARRRFVFKDAPPQTRASAQILDRAAAGAARESARPTRVAGRRLARSLSTRQWRRLRAAGGARREFSRSRRRMGAALAGNDLAGGGDNATKARSVIAPSWSSMTPAATAHPESFRRLVGSRV